MTTASAVAPTGAVVPPALAPLIAAAAARNGLDPALLAGVAWAASGCDPCWSTAAGARGVMGLMPATARALGVTDPFDPAASLDAGARHLRDQLDAFAGDLPLALAAFVAGRATVLRHGGVPPYSGTRAFVPMVLRCLEEFRSSGAPGGPQGRTMRPGALADREGWC